MWVHSGHSLEIHPWFAVTRLIVRESGLLRCAAAVRGFLIICAHTLLIQYIEICALKWLHNNTSCVIGDKINFPIGSVVRVRVKFGQVVVMVEVSISLEEMNVSLCKYPKSGRDCVRVCIFQWLTVSSEKDLACFLPIFLRMVSEIAFIFFPSPADLFKSELSHSSVSCVQQKLVCFVSFWSFW